MRARDRWVLELTSQPAEQKWPLQAVPEAFSQGKKAENGKGSRLMVRFGLCAHAHTGAHALSTSTIHID